MKKLLSILFCTFFLNNCSTVTVIGGSSLTSFEVASDVKTILDVISLTETGKTTNDHALSAVVDKDCNLFGIFKSDMEICKDKGTQPKRNNRFADNDSFVVATNYNPNEYMIKGNYVMDDQSRASKYFQTAKDIQKEKLEMFIHIFN